MIGTGNPTLVSVIGRTLDWRLKNGHTATPNTASASASVTVHGGAWVYSPEQLPYATERAHPYFTAPEGQTLAASLRSSAGRDAQLISFQMDSGWLITTWGGLVVMSGNDRMDQELSSGNGQRLYFQFPAPTLRDTVVAHHQTQPALRVDNVALSTVIDRVGGRRGPGAFFVEDPELLCRAGLIYCKNNQTEKGSELIAEAVKMNPFLHEDLLAEAKPFIPAQLTSVSSK